MNTVRNIQDSTPSKLKEHYALVHLILIVGLLIRLVHNAITIIDDWLEDLIQH